MAVWGHPSATVSEDNLQVLCPKPDYLPEWCVRCYAGPKKNLTQVRSNGSKPYTLKASHTHVASLEALMPCSFGRPSRSLPFGQLTRRRAAASVPLRHRACTDRGSRYTSGTPLWTWSTGVPFLGPGVLETLMCNF